MQMDLLYYNCFGADPTFLELTGFALLLFGVGVAGYKALRLNPPANSVAQLRLRRRSQR